MKKIYLLCLIFVVSCGEKSSSNNSVLSPSVEERQTASDRTESTPTSSEDNSSYCEGSLCYQNVDESAPIDLVETVESSSIKIEDEKIILEENSQPSSINEEDEQGCEIEFELGDEFLYKIKDKKLLLEMNHRKYVFVKLSEESEGIFGTWLWQGKENGQSVILTLIILPHEKLILRKNCELSLSEVSL
jgi:hypothetical protein